MLIIYCIGLFDGCFGSVSGSVGTAGCRFFCWDGEGRQRKVASVRAGTPSGDTTRAP